MNTVTDQRPVFSWDDLRARIIGELRIEMLPRAKQDEIISMIGEALIDRVTLSIWKKLPPEQLARMARESEHKDENDQQVALDLIETCRQHISNMEEVIDEALNDGLKSYHAFIDAEAAAAKTA